jgi:glutamate/tyrosine decarboxylase-like PLP-dependent enzyme
VVGAGVHITVLAALRLLGFGVRGARIVETDTQGRMSPRALALELAGLSGPTIVCAQVGNVNSGACDAIGEIAPIAHARGAWVHVDGAFGLWAAASATRRALVAGVEQADSWATDAHKWLNVPYDSGIVIVADPAAHSGAMSTNASYLEKSSGAARDPLDWAPEFSRRARGFTVYAALLQLGRRGVAEMVDRCCDHARWIAERLARDLRVEILNDVVLNQVLVRFRAADAARSDDLTRAVIRRVQRDGACWLGGTTWRGMAAMRISVSNWSTTRDDMECSAAAILRALDAEVDGDTC